jgi:hypothetical protein
MPSAAGQSNDHVGHAILNHVNTIIYVSQRALRYLDRHKYLSWSKRRHVWAFKKWFYTDKGRVPAIDVFVMLEGGAHATAVFRELGEDLSGPNVTICTCKRCRQLSRLQEKEEEQQRQGNSLSQAQIDAIKQRRRYQ